MKLFLTSIFSYPTVVFTVLLILVIIYWLFAIVGIVDIDSTDIDADIDIDGDIETDVGEVEHGISIANIFNALGLKDIPITIVSSLVILSSWTITSLCNMWILPYITHSIFKIILSTIIMILSLCIAIVITSLILRPLRRFFVSHNAVSKKTFIGSSCVVTTRYVDESFGRADIDTKGTSINVQIWCDKANSLKKGDTAVIIDYDSQKDTYLITPIE